MHSSVSVGPSPVQKLQAAEGNMEARNPKAEEVEEEVEGQRERDWLEVGGEEEVG